MATNPNQVSTATAAGKSTVSSGGGASDVTAETAAPAGPARSESAPESDSRRLPRAAPAPAPPPPPAAAALDWLRKAVFGTTEEENLSQSQSSHGADTKKLLKKIEASRDVSLLWQETRQDLDLIAAQFDLAVVHGGTSPPKWMETDPQTMQLYTAQLTIAARLRRLKNLLYVGFDDIAGGGGGGGPLNLARLSSFGGVTRDGDTALAAAQAVEYLTTVDSPMLPDLLENFLALPFEARKDTASIFNFLLMSGIDTTTAINGEPAEEDPSAPCEVLRVATDAFVRYVEGYYEDICTPLVLGHDCTGDATTVGQENAARECSPPVEGSAAVANSDDPQSRQSRPRPRRRSTPDVALHCGSMIRSLLSHFYLYQLFCSERYVARFVYPFVDSYVHQAIFEVSSDCLETLRMVMTGVSPTTGFKGHRPPRRRGGVDHANHDEAATEEVAMTTQDVARDFLDRCYGPLLEERFSRLLAEDAPYLTRRLSLQILSSLLLTRSNYEVMIRYVSSRRHLKLVMCLLRDASPHITFEAFQVFKVFVVNPDKKKEIVRVLTDNRDKLLRYMAAFHADREASDDQFRDEKALVIATLQALEHPDVAKDAVVPNK